MIKLQSILLNEYHSTHTHFFFTRTGGISKAPYNTLNCNTHSSDVNVHNNLDTVVKSFGAGCILKMLHQVHSSNVITIHTQQDNTQSINADALVTAVPNVILGIQTADCVPILLLDFQNKVIAAMHAGWKGAYAGIIANTVTAMVQLSANLNNTIACIGPCIRQSNYEINEEFRKLILQQEEKLSKNTTQSSEYINLFRPSVKENHWLFDLPQYCVLLLKASGITLIDDINIDTYSNPELLFSFRRAKIEQNSEHPATGGQISTIVLR